MISVPAETYIVQPDIILYYWYGVLNCMIGGFGDWIIRFTNTLYVSHCKFCRGHSNSSGGKYIHVYPKLRKFWSHQQMGHNYVELVEDIIK